MGRPLTSILEEKFAEYEDWVKRGVADAGIFALGQGLRLSAQSPNIRNDFVQELRSRVRPEHLNEAATVAMASWRRAMHIMSIGTEFNVDEIVLLLGLRQEVELLSEVLGLFGINTGELALGPIDNDLREIANAKVNRRAFASAFTLMRKNCGIPIDDIWSN